MIVIRVLGTPGPQGSKKLVGRDRKGRGILVESSAKVKPWREAVKWAAIESRYRPDHMPDAPTMRGPLEVSMVFTLARPKSAKKGALADKRPDLSKLIRSTEDALTDAGAWEDDARVVTCTARKVYPGTHPDALDVPGAVIRIRSLDAERPA